MTTARSLSTVTAALALVVATTAAHAQSTAAVDAARAYTDQGLAAEQAGDYTRALALYRQAYALVPHPLLLFDMGQAHRKAGHTEEALRHYQRYLDTDPHDPQREVATAFVARLEEQLAAERRSKEAAASAVAPGPSEPDLDEPAPDVTRAPGRRQRIVGASLVGAGVVSLAAGTYLELRARSLAADLSRPGAQYDPTVVADGEAAERHGALALAAGGVLVVGGAAVYLLARARAVDARRTARWAPALGPRFVGLVVATEWR